MTWYKIEIEAPQHPTKTTAKAARLFVHKDQLDTVTNIAESKDYVDSVVQTEVTDPDRVHDLEHQPEQAADAWNITIIDNDGNQFPQNETRIEDGKLQKLLWD